MAEWLGWSLRKLQYTLRELVAAGHVALERVGRRAVVKPLDNTVEKAVDFEQMQFEFAGDFAPIVAPVLHYSIHGKTNYNNPSGSTEALGALTDFPIPEGKKTTEPEFPEVEERAIYDAVVSCNLDCPGELLERLARKARFWRRGGFEVAAVVLRAQKRIARAPSSRPASWRWVLAVVENEFRDRYGVASERPRVQSPSMGDTSGTTREGLGCSLAESASGGQGHGARGEPATEGRIGSHLETPCPPLAESSDASPGTDGGVERGDVALQPRRPMFAGVPPISAGLEHAARGEPWSSAHHRESETNPARQAKPPTREEHAHFSDAIADLARGKSFAVWKATG